MNLSSGNSISYTETMVVQQRVLIVQPLHYEGPNCVLNVNINPLKPLARSRKMALVGKPRYLARYVGFYELILIFQNVSYLVKPFLIHLTFSASKHNYLYLSICISKYYYLRSHNIIVKPDIFPIYWCIFMYKCLFIYLFLEKIVV